MATRPQRQPVQIDASNGLTTAGTRLLEVVGRHPSKGSHDWTAITKAGGVTFVFKLRPGAHTGRLYRQIVKSRLRTIRITPTFTTPSGRRVLTTKNIKLTR